MIQFLRLTDTIEEPVLSLMASMTGYILFKHIKNEGNSTCRITSGSWMTLLTMATDINPTAVREQKLARLPLDKNHSTVVENWVVSTSAHIQGIQVEVLDECNTLLKVLKSLFLLHASPSPALGLR